MVTQRKDSTIYRIIFEYIKENGVIQLTRFCTTFDTISHNKTEDLFYDYVFRNKDWFAEIAVSNQEAINFFKQFNNGFLNWTSLFSKEFCNFIFDISKNIENIDLFLENSKKLDQLDIDIIKLANPNKIQFYEDYGQYLYSDGIRHDTDKKVMFDNANWVLIEKQAQDKIYNYRSIVINDFGANLSELPGKNKFIRKK